MSEERIILGPIIGAVDHETAKIWFYGEWDGEGKQTPFCHVFNCDGNVTIAGSPFEFKEISSSPYAFKGKNGKAFLAEIKFPADGDEFRFFIDYRQAVDQKPEKSYPIKRAPADGDFDFSFGLISCHKMLGSIPRDEQTARVMWNHLHSMMMKHNSRFLIQAGDQVYCDHPKNNAWDKSKKSDDFQQMLGYYRDVYLDGWNFPQVQRVLGGFPQYMIWDDHEITNGWGSKKSHHTGEKSRKIFEAARQAYFEFQHSHNPAPLEEGMFYYAFKYGNAAFLVMDLRGHRNITLAKKSGSSPLVGDKQWEKITQWLQGDSIKKSKLLFVITSVPVVHLSRKFGSLGWLKSDIADQWSTDKNKNERRKLLKLLFEWTGEKNKPVFILGGDVHVGTEVCIVEDSQKRVIYQVTSSPIANAPAWFLDYFMAAFSSRFSFHLAEGHKYKIVGRVLRRHRKRNFAIFDVDYDDENNPRVALSMYRQGETEPRVREFRFGPGSQ